MSATLAGAGAMVLLSACGSNPSPASTPHPANVAGVFYCAVNVMQAAGWELEEESQAPETEFKSASLTQGSDGTPSRDGTQAYRSRVALSVGRTEQGEIDVRMRTGLLGSPVWVDQMQQAIATKCL